MPDEPATNEFSLDDALIESLFADGHGETPAPIPAPAVEGEANPSEPSQEVPPPEPANSPYLQFHTQAEADAWFTNRIGELTSEQEQQKERDDLTRLLREGDDAEIGKRVKEAVQREEARTAVSTTERAAYQTELIKEAISNLDVAGLSAEEKAAIEPSKFSSVNDFLYAVADLKSSKANRETRQQEIDRLATEKAETILARQRGNQVRSTSPSSVPAGNDSLPATTNSPDQLWDAVMEDMNALRR